jgi:uncharacterized protein (DUF2147 family)
MQNIKFLVIVCLFLCSFSLFAHQGKQDNPANIEGFWKTINENTKKPESVIAIYKYKGEYFGRIILTYFEDGTIQDTIYNPKKKALGVPGHPPYVGLDIIWGLKPAKGNKYKDGSILDPEKGDIYGAEAWRKAGDLIVRGKLFIFGRNQTWPRAVEKDFPEGFQVPDYTSFVPVIPQTI